MPRLSGTAVAAGRLGNAQHFAIKLAPIWDLFRRALETEASQRRPFLWLPVAAGAGGARGSEPALIEWERHVLDDRVVFDPETTKMGRGHAVPRTVLVDEVLADAKRFRRAASDLVFPSGCGTPFSAFSKSVAQLIKQAGVAKFTMHDLRRTFRTIASKCGYDNEIQRLCVGQKPQGIDAIYNLDEQWQIRKMAFEAAHAYITAVIRGCSTNSVVWMQRASSPQNRFKAQLLDAAGAL